MTENADDMAIVSSIISLAHGLDMTVVAEGVETEEQRKRLRLLRSDARLSLQPAGCEG
jgi:EAL domain-containing protein (putative c-di-GMP-specific phosphodiesterase class I)